MSDTRNLLNISEGLFCESLDNPSAGERKMQELGWSFTGVYERDKDKVIERQKRPEYKGYKTKVVRVPDSKLSRGPVGVGWSLYAEPRYFEDKREKEAIARKEREIAAMKKERETIKARLAEINKQLGDE